MSSITVTLTGKSSNLSANFYPEIVLDDRFDYSCSLLDFYTYNYIPNVNDQNNKLVYTLNSNTDTSEMKIPIGSYEIHEIIQYINKHFAELGFFIVPILKPTRIHSSVLYVVTKRRKFILVMQNRLENC